MSAVPGTPVVAMVGGGQLARMTHQSAIALGMSLRVLAVSPEDPAAQVSPDVVVGPHTDLQALRAVAEGAAALTFDHEH
ncbi:MAG: 5-(carboxyamino)imidazole ribonucleotide synthase, partial [Mycobacterium sp.]|nr:5-(carboxyamino)imidazole ribonucleotide synthase [Mycobacterium sp.]